MANNERCNPKVIVLVHLRELCRKTLKEKTQKCKAA